MIKLVLLGECLKEIRSELSTIVCYEGVRYSVSTKMPFSGLDDCGRLNCGEFVDFIKITVMVNRDQIGETIEFKQVLRDKLPW